MNRQKKLLPVWMLVLTDILIIAIYTGGFYWFYYLTPRQLEASGIKTVQAETSSSSQDNEVATTEDVSESKTSNLANSSNETSTTDSARTVEITNSTTNFAAKFADKFTDNVVSTENSYTSSDISISVNQYTKGSGNNLVTYYVADIYVANITNLQSGFADNIYGVGYTDDVLDMDESLNAILAMNGDYYGNGGDGVVIRNGEVYRSTTSDSDVCVLYYDGTMKTFTAEEFDVDQAIADGAYQAWCFGPELLDGEGNSVTNFTADRHVKDYNPRSAIGYYEPGHYCLVVVDGRQNGYSQGMTLSELSSLFQELGCTSAYNLDGGKSSEMTFNDAYVNQPSDGGREVSDSIIIKEVQ